MTALDIEKIKSIADKYALFIGRVIIGFLFVYSGFSKLTRPIEYFEVAIIQYDIIPVAFTRYIAVFIPWVEFIFGFYLLAGLGVYLAGGVLLGLTVLFQLVLGQALIRRLPFSECGCFGGDLIQLTLYQSFLLDSGIVLWLIYIVTSKLDNFTLDKRL